MEFKAKMKVRNKTTNKEGVLLPTIYLLTMDGDDELSVSYGDGGSATLNIEGGRENFELLGPEDAIADPTKCGAGKGKACCKFLVVGSNGFECARNGSLHYTIIFKQMTATMEPSSLYPHCQEEITEAVKKEVK